MACRSRHIPAPTFLEGERPKSLAFAADLDTSDSDGAFVPRRNSHQKLSLAASFIREQVRMDPGPFRHESIPKSLSTGRMTKREFMDRLYAGTISEVELQRMTSSWVSQQRGVAETYYVVTTEKLDHPYRESVMHMFRDLTELQKATADLFGWSLSQWGAYYIYELYTPLW